MGRPTSGAMPDLVEPMEVGSGQLPAGQDWAIEFAWEGLRVIAYARPSRVKLLTATGRHVTGTFPDLEGPVSRAAPPGGVVLDGTIVALQQNGLPRRRALQSRIGSHRPSDALIRRVPVGFLVSDLLWCDGRSTLELPYHRRHELLSALDFDEVGIWSSPSFPVGELGPVMVAAEQHGVDALYARQLDAPYRPGKRSRYLLRLPVRRVRQVFVGGWTPAGPRVDSIGALLLGVPDGSDPGTLRYLGRVGLRTAADRRAVAGVLPDLGQPSSPFTAPLPADVTEYARWLAPRLVGRVEFADWTPDGRLRLPTWRGTLPADQVDSAQLAQPPDVETAPPAQLPEPAPPQAIAHTPAIRPTSHQVATSPPDDVEPAIPATGSTSDIAPAPQLAAPTEPDPFHRTEERRLEQHFVYNALNTIASVIRTDPKRARDLLLGFADLNRAADRPPGTASTLADELAVVRSYLELEQARFGTRLRVEIDVDPSLHELAVGPLELLDAVRTIVQARIEPRPDGGTLTLRGRPAAGKGPECLVGLAESDVTSPIVIKLGANAG